MLTRLARIEPGAKPVKVAEKEFSSFQRMLRSRLARVDGVQEVVACEVQVPAGEGYEGGYFAVVRTRSGTELRYLEQVDHRPRGDRYFHRQLMPEEVAQVDAFVREHPLDSAHKIAPATISVNTEEAAETSTQPAGPGEELTLHSTKATLPRTYRLTRALAKQKSAQTLSVDETLDYPAAELAEMLLRFRDAGAVLPALDPDAGAAPPEQIAPRLVCTYVQAIPSSAALLFAHPEQHVIGLWRGDGRVRIAIARDEAWHSLNPDAEDGALPEHRWLALVDGTWRTAEAPPEPEEDEEASTTQEAGGIATLGSEGDERVPPRLPTAAVVPQDVNSAEARAPVEILTPATAPSRFSSPGYLPEEEMWWAEPAEHSTTVWHYTPMGDFHGYTTGFVLPTLVFDDDHAAIDPEAGVLYFIHDGQLFSLPLPMTPKRK